MRALPLGLAAGLFTGSFALAGSEGSEEPLAQLSRELQARTQECEASFQALQAAVENNTSSGLDAVAAMATKSCGAAYENMEIVARIEGASYAALKAIDSWWGFARQQVLWRATAGRAAQSALQEHKAVAAEPYQFGIRQQATYGELASEGFQKVRGSFKEGPTKTPRLNHAAATKLRAFRTSAERSISECNKAFDELQQVMHFVQTASGPTPPLQAYGVRTITTCETASVRLQKITVPHLAQAIEEALEDWAEALRDRAAQQRQAGLAASYYSNRPDGRDLEVYRKSAAVSKADEIKARDAIHEATRLAGLDAE